MPTRRSLVLVVALLSTTLIGSASAERIPGSDHGGRPLATTLTGSEEVPGPGDPDGSGTALITLTPGQREVCWSLTAADITLPAAAAHIHRGPVGVAGPIVVGLSPPGADGKSVGCTDGDRPLLDEIRTDPAGFYVNVHTADFPGGAIRGQLSK